jgi:hypothetical protein
MHLQARHGGRHTRRPAVVHNGRSEVGARRHDPLGKRTLRAFGVRYDDDEPAVLIVEDMSK